MKKNAIYTSITSNYLPKALALFESVFRFGDIDFYCVVNEYRRTYHAKLPRGFKLLFLEDILQEEWRPWILMHSIVELCTATKPYALGILHKLGYEVILYLDPDIFVYNDLEPLFIATRENGLTLCPHILRQPMRYSQIVDNEISALKHGTFNLGYLGVNHDRGGEIFDFWSSRCFHFCDTDTSKGVFTDQKFFDMASIYFPYLKIIRNMGGDVASWNLHERRISVGEGGRLYANEDVLLFYHFTSYDSGVGLKMSRIYGNESPVVYEMWMHYSTRLQQIVQNLQPDDITNALPRFSDATEVTGEHRAALRKIFARSRNLEYRLSEGPHALAQFVM